jgi:hypothetical protein
MTAPLATFAPREFYSDFSPTHMDNGKPVMLMAEHSFYEYPEVAVRDKAGKVKWFKKEDWKGEEI